MSGNRSKLIAFNYFGGKFTYLQNLYELFPSDFTHLVDVFGGSFAVSLNYPGKVIKTANDINSDITNFFKVLRDHQNELINLLLLTPCSEEEYTSCWEPSPDKVEQARRFYVRARQSFFGLGAQHQNKGFHLAKTNVNCRGGETVSRWNNAIEKLYQVAEVLRSNFQILNDPYQKVFERMDFPKALFYLDPPYVPDTRASHDDYKFDFSEQKHIELFSRAITLKGYVILSGYDCPLYKELYQDYVGWWKTELPYKNNGIRNCKGLSKNEREGNRECVWTNYDPSKGMGQEKISFMA